MNPSEAQIQQAILTYLQMLENHEQLYFLRNNSFAGYIQRNNGSVGRIRNNKAGTPDIIICYQGRFVGIEVKSPKGRQSVDQLVAQQVIEKCGGVYILARDVDDVRKRIR